ncbi:hypothetical protein DO73_5343 [Burkholderia pseudomallei]|nr:hypothetical protein DO73_5343 [Burkholderia pseudomallei]
MPHRVPRDAAADDAVMAERDPRCVLPLDRVERQPVSGEILEHERQPLRRRVVFAERVRHEQQIELRAVIAEQAGAVARQRERAHPHPFADVERPARIERIQRDVRELGGRGHRLPRGARLHVERADRPARGRALQRVRGSGRADDVQPRHARRERAEQAAMVVVRMRDQPVAQMPDAAVVAQQLVKLAPHELGHAAQSAFDERRRLVVDDHV